MMTTTERRAFENMVDAARAGLHALALRLAGNENDAADLVQETLLRAYVNFPRLRLDARQAPWLRTILKHLFVDEYRRRARLVSLAAYGTEQLPAPELPTIAKWRQVSAEDADRALEHLPCSLRHTYELFTAGCSYGEIARRMGVRPATVGVRILRARERLRVV